MEERGGGLKTIEKRKVWMTCLFLTEYRVKKIL